MRRPRYPERSGELPPPLPPETRTVGQLVAESLRLYGRRFWLALPLGLSLAAVDQIGTGHGLDVQTLLLWAASPLLTLSYLGASLLATDTRPAWRSASIAFSAGLLVFLPVPLLLRLFVLPAVAWLALVGLCVPVALVERRGLLESVRRARELGRADYVHALAGLATLFLTYFLTRLVLVFLLRGFGEAADRLAAFLADLVLSPLVFLGAALLYVDQVARLRLRSSPRGYASPSASHSRR